MNERVLVAEEGGLVRETTTLLLERAGQRITAAAVIRRLRGEQGPDAREPRDITTVRGAGYRLPL